MMMKLLLVLLSPVFAYIPPTRMILQRTAENSGSGIYAIEQEVQFNNVHDSLFLRETWLVENDRTMRVTVSGTKDLKDQIKLQFIYAGGQRWSQNLNRESRRISEEFIERYFNFRSTEHLAANLMQNKILPPNAFAKKPLPKNLDTLKYEPDEFVRLSRTGGVANYAFGVPTPAEGTPNPGLWIEQDQFLIRKLRLPSQVEVTADNYTQYARGLNYPKVRTVRWGQNTVTIRLIGINARPAAANVSQFQPSSLDTSTKLDGLLNQPAREAVIEFYSRFR